MSDKHTDAPGELPELPTATFKGTGLLITTGGVIECEYYDVDQMREYARAAIAHRATEGQAQTSAAAEQLAIAREALEKISAWRFGWDGDCGVTTVANDALTAIDAAQLADSTAPGASTDQERADFEQWYVTHIDGAEIGSADCAARWSTWLARSDGFYKAPGDWKISPMPWNAPAAPTAQQSLTAGGAVPVAYVNGDELENMLDDRLALIQGVQSGFRKTPLYAAPLPQVQSEALDEVPIECWSSNQEDFNCDSLVELIENSGNLKPGDTVWVGGAVTPRASELIDAEDVITTMGERAYDISSEHSDCYPDVTEEAEAELNALLAAWISKHARPTFWTVANVKPYVLSDDDFAADQQPVTPSVALADNDGGVA